MSYFALTMTWSQLPSNSPLAPWVSFFWQLQGSFIMLHLLLSSSSASSSTWSSSVTVGIVSISSSQVRWMIAYFRPGVTSSRRSVSLRLVSRDSARLQESITSRWIITSSDRWRTTVAHGHRSAGSAVEPCSEGGGGGQIESPPRGERGAVTRAVQRR